MMLQENSLGSSKTYTFNEDYVQILEVKKGKKRFQCKYCGRIRLSKANTKSQQFCSRSCVIKFHRCCFKHIGFTHEEYVTKAETTELKKLHPKGRTRKKTDPKKDNFENVLDTSARKKLYEDSLSDIDRSSECSTSVDKDIEILEVVNKAQPITLFESDPSKWNVQEVSDFLVRTGYSDCVEKFQFNEIDGEVLLMLELHHLMHMMEMKLGSAVKLLSTIKTLKNMLDVKNLENKQESQ